MRSENNSPEFKKSQDQPVFGLCRKCFIRTSNKDLSNFGAMCKPCFDFYCSEPVIMRSFNRYPGDPKGWARTLIEREIEGEKISEISIRFAKQALRMKEADGN
jgi:hypothetical protein